MEEAERNHLTEVEALLRGKFGGKKDSTHRIPSTARASTGSARVDQLTLPDNERGGMPFTKEKYLVRENPGIVQWEREVRKFLRQLSPDHAHRVSAAMVYEWATGILVTDLVAAGGSTTDLKRINRILRFYFGQPYMTYICGRKVPNAFRVKLGYRIRRHRPMTLTLYAEYCEGVLNP